MSSTLTFRPDGHASWQSEDWRWTIVSRPVSYPDNGGPRVFSVKDYTTESWVEQDFASFEAAAEHCQRVHDNDLAGGFFA